MTRPISISRRLKNLRFSQRSVRQQLAFLDQQSRFAIPNGELSVVFLGTRGMSQLHRDFLGDTSLTDVITFPGDPEENLAGEICVCPPVAAKQAAEFETTFSDELNLYIIHGWLHLAGLDDTNDEARQEMRAAEKETLQLLRENDLMVEYRIG